MQINIEVRDIPLTEGLRRHVVERVEAALQRYKCWVRRVDVSVGEGRGRGRVGSFCRVLVRFNRLPSIALQDLGADVHGVIDRVVARVAGLVGRRLAQRLAAKRFFGMGRALPPPAAETA